MLLLDSKAGQDFAIALTHVDAAGLPIEPALAIELAPDLPATGPGNAPQPLAVTFTEPAYVTRGTRYALVVPSDCS